MTFISSFLLTGRKYKSKVEDTQILAQFGDLSSINLLISCLNKKTCYDINLQGGITSTDVKFIKENPLVGSRVV
jgi:hypothetical protein